MKLALYSAIAGLVVGGILAHKLFPRIETQVKVETRTVTEYKTRIVERWTKDPNGNETHERTEESSGTTASESTSTKSVAKHNWNLGVQAGLTTDMNGVKYGLRAERRIIGPIFAGGYITTNKEAGISLGMEF